MLVYHHEAFLDNCLRDCLLSSMPVLKIFQKLLSICEIFATYVARFSATLQKELPCNIQRGPRRAKFKRRRALQLQVGERLTVSCLLCVHLLNSLELS
jgi:Gamma tubulin complex component C-terminal